jgi:nicotinamidase-related amidase
MLKRARALEIPIFYTTIAYTDPTKEAGLWGVKVPWLYHCQVGSTAVDIDARLEVRPNEPVIVKKFPSALFQTDLLSQLNQLRIDTVLLAGCTASVCIHATAIDMMQHGFKPLMVAEAIGEFDQQLHALSLKDLDSRYGDVISIHDALSYLSALKDEGNKLL